MHKTTLNLIGGAFYRLAGKLGLTTAIPFAQ